MSEQARQASIRALLDHLRREHPGWAFDAVQNPTAGQVAAHRALVLNPAVKSPNGRNH